MDGSIGVRSDEGGAEFWVTVPAAQAEASAPAVVIDEPPPAAERPAEAAPRTALYIEDSPANVAFVGRVLRMRPHVTLLSASDGTSGLAMARRHAPDLVLLDFGLPDVHGDEVLEALKADPQTASIPVVVLTADATRGLDERLLSAGAEAVELKPLDLQRLLWRIDAALGGSP
jgi:CheY-like chemotaxis protein